MGSVAGLPVPIKLQLQDIQCTKFEYVLDSTQFDNNYKYVSKACGEIAKNKTIQKVVLKLFFPTASEKDLTKAIEKLLETKGTIVIYGSNLVFFNHSKWTRAWGLSRVTNLQIKFELFSIGFEYLLQGLKENKSVKILGFRFLNEYQLPKLGECLSHNPSIYHLQIVLENRVFTLDNMEEGINSTKIPSSPQINIPVSFLSQCKHVITFTLGGYQERPNFISGIIQNSSIKSLVLENIDIEKALRHDWNVAFKENFCLEEVKTIRGLNTLSALILFQSLRKNTHVSSLILEESVFFDHGFIGLDTLLKATISIRHLSLKNLLHLNINKFSQTSPINNLCKVLEGLSENRSITDVYIGNHPASSNDIERLDENNGALSRAFHKLFVMNKTLRNLSIEYFRIGSESFDGISEGLSVNQTIEKLAVKGNLIQWNDLARFLHEVRENQCLEYIDFMGNALVKNLDFVDKATFEEVFTRLAQSNLKKFVIDNWFWDLSVYPQELFEVISEVKLKFG